MNAEIKAKEIEIAHKLASTDLVVLSHTKTTEELLRFIATKLVEINLKLAKIDCELRTDSYENRG